MNLSGSTTCRLTRTGDNGEEVLHEAELANERQCQKLCDIVGPLHYSSSAEITCSQGNSIIYSGRRN